MQHAQWEILRKRMVHNMVTYKHEHSTQAFQIAHLITAFSTQRGTAFCRVINN